MSRIFHLYLESIALEADSIQIYGFQYLTSVADESGCGIMYLETGYDTHVFRSEIAHQHTSDRPVDHVHTRNIS